MVRRGLGVLVVATAVLISSSSAFAGVLSKGGDPFCAGTKIRADTKPFAAMPRIHRLPSSGRLPFAPQGLEISLIGLRQVVVGAGDVGIYVSQRSSSTVHVKWNVSARLTPVDARGHSRGVARRYMRQINTAGATKRVPLAFHVGGKPTFYRFDISFTSPSGRPLGSYAEYFRVVRRKVKVELALSASTYMPGSVLLARLKNPGTVSIVYGYDFKLEHWTGESWVLDPATPKGWLMVALGLGGGGAAKCERIPLGTVPGTYRATKEYSLVPAGHEVPVRAEFEIVG